MKKSTPLVLLLLLINTPSLSSSDPQSDMPKRKTLEKEDEKLLLIFSSLVSCFANILKDPHNPRNLAVNLTAMATGVLNMLLNTMNCKTHPFLIREITKIKALTTQRFHIHIDP